MPHKKKDKKPSHGATLTPLEKKAVEQNLHFYAIPTDPEKGEELPTDRVCYGALQKEQLEFNFDEMKWTQEEGEQTLKVTNRTPMKVAFKMKCSDNDVFWVRPVFGTMEIEEVKEITIHRKAAPPKVDKIVFCSAKFESTEPDLEAYFKKPSTVTQDKQILQIAVATQQRTSPRGTPQQQSLMQC
ncbi:Major sperm protein [Trichostrongylus colubriformis]|uniref:Major sperm protein n=1 Tax=Trichostrongylus colubriformis TaxID=6319 RepID=A0AAN8I9M5_TRICO